MSKKDFFFVYNKNLGSFLKERGHEVITIAQDLKTKKVFSLFQITTSLQTSLEEYKALKK
jgi:hypothetical protein